MKLLVKFVKFQLPRQLFENKKLPRTNNNTEDIWFWKYIY